MAGERLEERVSDLQRVIAELQRKVAALETQPKDDWLPAVLGRFKNDPDFDAIARSGAQFRESGGFPDDAPAVL